MADTMTLTKAKSFLQNMVVLSAEDQRKNVSQINEAFEVFMESHPTRHEFNTVVRYGLILTTDMLYTIWTTKNE